MVKSADTTLDIDPDDFEETTEGFRSLRKALNKALRVNRDLNDEVTTFRTQAQVSTVQDRLKALGLKPEAAKFYQGDTSDDALKAWAEENRELFGVPPEGAGDGNEAPPAAPEDPVAAAERALAERLAGTTAGATPSDADKAAITAISSAGSKQELMAALGLPI